MIAYCISASLTLIMYSTRQLCQVFLELFKILKDQMKLISQVKYEAACPHKNHLFAERIFLLVFLGR